MADLTLPAGQPTAKFKGGILVNQISGVPVADMVALGQQAERLGYSRCWVADQGLESRDVYVTLAAIAQNTTTIRLGPGITNPYTRHPVTAAAGIASLDELSGGRVFHGIGAGGLDTLGPLGLERPKPVAAVREMIRTTRALYRGEVVNFSGQLIKLSGARLGCARPDVEIWVAGRGSQMLSLAGELADGVMLGFIHKDTLQDYLDPIWAGAARSGNQPKLCYYAMLISDEQMLAAVRPYVFYLLADSPPRVKEMLGISPAELRAIHQVLISDGLAEAGKLIKEEWIRPIAIMGSLAECAAELTQIMTRFRIDEFLLPILEATAARDRLDRVAAALVLS